MRMSNEVNFTAERFSLLCSVNQMSFAWSRSRLKISGFVSGTAVDELNCAIVSGATTFPFAVPDAS